MEAVITVWLLSLGVSQTAGVALISRVHMCRDTCMKTGMCVGPTLPDMIACYINTGHRKDKGFEKQNDQEPEVTEIVCVTEGSTRGCPRCLFDRCTVFVGPKLASECRPPPWELRDVADKVYNCTRVAHRSVLNGYEEYTVGNETIYVKEYTTEKTWDQAAQQCCSDGARLIKLNSSERLNAIKRQNREHWIGLRDMNDNDTFFWVDGSPLRFQAWDVSEPSHLSPVYKKENCAHNVLSFLSIKWNDNDCNQTKPFLCEQLF